MTEERAKRDRLAKNPGGMQCENCDEIFIGEEWHAYCALCQSYLDMKRSAADGEGGTTDAAS